MKIYPIGVLVCAVFGLTLECRSVGLESIESRRVEAPRMRRVNIVANSDSSVGECSGSSSLKTTVSSRDSHRSVKTSATSSLLPDGFDSEDGTQQKTSSSLAKQKVFSSDGLAMKDDIKVEYGEGCGETTDEALKEAMKDVLQKVVGVYVDSDFRMNNDKIIKDEIITHSNGFIDHYKKMEEFDDPNGRGKCVTIKAWVKVRDFVKRMQKIAPKQKVKVDGLLLDNELENNLNAETLLRKEFENFDPVMDLMDVRLVDSIRPEIQSSDANSVVLRYVFVIKHSKEKYYRQFVPRITKVLDQIAVKKRNVKSGAFNVVQVGCCPYGKDMGGVGGGNWEKHQVRSYCLFGRNSDFGVSDDRTPNTISVIQNITRGGVATVYEWKMHEHLMRIYQDLIRKYYANNQSVKCVFSVFGDDGRQFSQTTQDIDMDYLGGGYMRCFDFMPLMPGDYCLERAKLDKASESKLFSLGCGNSYLDRYIGYVDITIDKSDVKMIKSAEIKLETNKKGENE